MIEFEKQIHNMFDHIWDCKVEHPVFNDTVGDLMTAVIQCYNKVQADVPDKNVGDMISKQAEPLELQFEQVGTHIIKTCPTCHTPWRVPPTSEYLMIAKYPCCPCGQRIRWEWRDE